MKYDNQQAEQRKNNSKDLFKGSPIVRCVERIFAGIHWLFNLPIRLFEWLACCIKYGAVIEMYMLLWLIIGAVLFVCFYRTQPEVPQYLAYIFAIFAGWRIVDIVQKDINIALFDHLCKKSGNEVKKDEQEIKSLTRSIILSVYNYIELIYWFGLVYICLPVIFLGIGWKAYLVSSNHSPIEWYDPFYFSAITQLTIGYGDILPVGIAKLIIVIQGIIGWAFTLFVLARLVNSLPKLRDEE